MPTEPKDAQMAYRIPTSLKNELQKLADTDKRKLGPYVQLVLEEHVATKAAGKTAGKRKRLG